MCVNACFDRLAYLSISIAWRQTELQPILHIASECLAFSRGEQSCLTPDWFMDEIAAEVKKMVKNIDQVLQELTLKEKASLVVRQDGHCSDR